MKRELTYWEQQRREAWKIVIFCGVIILSLGIVTTIFGLAAAKEIQTYSYQLSKTTMQLKIKCDCGGKIVSHTMSPTPLWICDRCTKRYNLDDLRLPDEPKPEEKPNTLECEHFFRCTICGAESNCE